MCFKQSCRAFVKSHTSNNRCWALLFVDDCDCEKVGRLVRCGVVFGDKNGANLSTMTIFVKSRAMQLVVLL